MLKTEVMKRILYISIMTTMIFSSLEISFYKHFCEGEITSFELYERENKSCCCEHNDPCDKCEDEKSIWSLDDFNLSKITTSFLLPLSESTAEPVAFISIFPTVTLDYTLYTHFNDHLGWSGKQRSILYQSFLL
tara:strand:- start:3570 stop:3971 length:402 start_codon:yes stop_codon:yes gene_type:complete